MTGDASKTTDTIPRASITQILGTLGHLASVEKSNYDEVRRFIYTFSGRRAPASSTALWTVARDVLTELGRLGLVVIGTLPRRRSDVERLRDSPCEVTPAGKELAQVHATRAGQAYDTLLIAWLDSHPYFRALITRILGSLLFVPDVTSASQVGSSRAADELGENVFKNCRERLATVDFAASKMAVFEKAVRRRVLEIAAQLASPEVDSKKLVDLVQDSVVIPALLEAEQLAFDGVTFQHLLKIAGEFFAGASTTSHPDFSGRVVFSTCDFSPTPVADGSSKTTAVEHHGRSFAWPRFVPTLASAYSRITANSGGYADAYAVRAIVCVELRIQPPVFAACLKDMIAAGETADSIIYTELPFAPPPQGEGYVEVGGRRIGRLKLSSNRGV